MGEAIQPILHEIKHPRYNKAKAKLMALPMLASLTIAACTGGSGTAQPELPATTQPIPESTVTTPSSSSTLKESPLLPNITVPDFDTLAANFDVADCKPYYNPLKYKNHEGEVCFAYIVNSEQIALQFYYRYGNNNITYASDAFRHHFETRYWGPIRQAIEKGVDAWPKTSNADGNKVEDDITLVKLTSDLPANRALLHTQERWRVTDQDGKMLHDEPLHEKDITMCRVKLPGHLLHEWVVVSYAPLADYDCKDFAAANGLAP